MPGATFEAFDIVVVPFPFTDRAATRRRPALVVSTTLFNRDHDHCVLAMITTAKQSHWPTDAPLADWRGSGLVAACRVRFKLFTLERSLVLRRLGSLSAADRARVVTGLMACLAI